MSNTTPASRVVPSPIAIPPAPIAQDDVAALDPLIRQWAAERPMYRCYDVSWGSRDFYAGGQARFHPFSPDGRQTPVPVLYAADDIAGALSESVFHDVPIRGVKRVPLATLNHRLIVCLSPGRTLDLIDLTSPGLRRLGLSREELIASDPRSYPETAQWARALHDHPSQPDGLFWVSRQHDESRCVVLFGGRVDVATLTVPDDYIPLVLAAGAGLEEALAAAERAGITITGIAQA